MSIYELMSFNEVMNLPIGGGCIYDTESYPNLWAAAFLHLPTKKVFVIERSQWGNFRNEQLHYMFSKFMTIGFNNFGYDEFVCSGAIQGYDEVQLFDITQDIIVNKLPRKAIVEKWKIDNFFTQRLDIQNVCPLQHKLKMYAARIHSRSIKTLPYPPGTVLTYEQSREVIEYMINDLEDTFDIVDALQEQLILRKSLSETYKINLMSRSDAQIAEAIFASEISKITGQKVKTPKFANGHIIRYTAPENIVFKTPRLMEVLKIVQNCDFVLAPSGQPKLPPELARLKFSVGGLDYKIAMGGLHSNEKSIAHIACDAFKLRDADVTSFYPFIILLLKLFPPHIGEAFLKVYQKLVDERVKAKKLSSAADLSIAEKMAIAADALKIVINGSFGKLGSMFSKLYAPELMLKVTISGQLYLLMFIEALTLAHIEVVSANTDGVVSKVPPSLENAYKEVCEWWMNQTGFKLEFSEYSALYSRDVNNYFAVKSDGEVKAKGQYSNPWAGGKKTAIFRFHKNPEGTIISEAVSLFLSKGAPIEETILNCKDIRKFVVVRGCSKGAEHRGEYLGTVLRWYYSTGIEYKTSYFEICGTAGKEVPGDGYNTFAHNTERGDKVPNSEGAKPCQILPTEFPNDIDYNVYIDKAKLILLDIGQIRKPSAKNLF